MCFDPFFRRGGLFGIRYIGCFPPLTLSARRLLKRLLYSLARRFLVPRRNEGFRDGCILRNLRVGDATRLSLVVTSLRHLGVFILLASTSLFRNFTLV